MIIPESPEINTSAQLAAWLHQFAATLNAECWRGTGRSIESVATAIDRSEQACGLPSRLADYIEAFGELKEPVTRTEPRH
jgi:hypothetical protein